MRVLGVFAKQPVAGSVKTRLARETSPEWAAEVAAAFLADTLDRVAHVHAERFIAFTPPEAHDWFDTVSHGRFELHAQADGDLGARMREFFEASIARGAEATVILGTDSPTMPLDFVARAFGLLSSADVVLGPAHDGGYYLIGCGRRVPPVFDGIVWGTQTVFADTVARLDAVWSLARLPPWHDVDTSADWQALARHIAVMRSAGIDPGVPRTEALCHRA